MYRNLPRASISRGAAQLTISDARPLTGISAHLSQGGYLGVSVAGAAVAGAPSIGRSLCHQSEYNFVRGRSSLPTSYSLHLVKSNPSQD